MAELRHYDTVAFDVREATSMLFFARTSSTGDIEDYLLVMRAEGADDGVYLEVNDQLLAGHDLVRSAELAGNVLMLKLREPAASLGNTEQIVLAFDDTEENRSGMEAGAFRVFGALLEGGSA